MVKFQMTFRTEVVPVHTSDDSLHRTKEGTMKAAFTIFLATATMFSATMAFGQSNTNAPIAGYAAGGGYVVAPIGQTASGVGAVFILDLEKKSVSYCWASRDPNISTCTRPGTDTNPGCYRVACSDTPAQLK
jgi:hypothetical protein